MDPELQATWTGFYAGVSLGVSRNQSNMTGQGYDATYNGFASLEGNYPDTPHHSNTSLAGSLEAGYNWQIQNYVVGVAVDITRLSSKHTSGAGYDEGTHYSDPDTMSSNVDYLGTLRARLQML